MSDDVRKLEPKSLWNFFEDLNAIPRGSKKEDKIREYVREFGVGLGFDTHVDSIGNVIIKKPASPGMENRETVVLQGHLDMVHQKNADTDFDFDKEGIRSYVDGDWVKADGTTLGADNGIGVAAILAILASKDIKHPPIEALFTIDEETGMTGAIGLKGGELSGKFLLNLDTEDDDELTIGCAGGVDTTGEGRYEMRSVNNEFSGVEVKVSGLTGGHSGMDIHLGRANANKLMNRLLWGVLENFDAYIAEIDGGSLRNAIPRESVAVLAVKYVDGFKEHIEEMAEKLKDEYRATDPDMKIEVRDVATPASVMEPRFQSLLVRGVYAIPNDVHRMSPDIPGLTETSTNLSRVVVKDGMIKIESLQRSAIESAKMDIATGVRAAMELMGLQVKHEGSYPGWTPRPDSEIVGLMRGIYKEMFNEEPKVNACHAGLECGILGTNYPEMQMISFGPNIRGAHSPDEKVSISSVQKFWKYLLKTLEEIPEKS